ncbi:MAG: glycosyltransferase family 2 protein [Bacteroidales bacterium]|nr:glycosyltransferase family 2 protein [Bacteroidales bacterium]
MDPLISVIMPVRNGAKYIREALDSLFRQGCRLEVIVVDDGSEDETAAIAAEYGCRVLSHPVSQGPVVAKNTGLQAATGDFVLFMDHDDRMREGALKTLCETLSGNPGAAAAEAMVRDFLSPECTPGNVSLREEPYYGLFTGAILIRRSVFGIIGPFNSALTAGEIIDWSDRMALHGQVIRKIDLVSTDRRVHDSNFGRTRRNEQFKDFASVLRARLKNGR